MIAAELLIMDIFTPTVETTTSTSCGAVPLRKWIECEIWHQSQHKLHFQKGGFDDETLKRAVLLRATTIAYGIAVLFRLSSHANTVVVDNVDDLAFADSVGTLFKEHYTIDNFLVRDHRAARASVCAVAVDQSSTINSSTSKVKISRKWDNIHGVDMISIGASVNISEPYFLRSICSDNDDNDQEDPAMNMGRYLGVQCTQDYSPIHAGNGRSTAAAEAVAVAQHAISKKADTQCFYALGMLLRELFYCLSPSILEQDVIESLRPPRENVHEEPACKKSASAEAFVPLMGYPSSICLLIQHLLRCDDEDSIYHYDSLNAVVKDLHLLLLDPSRFLFGNEPPLESGSAQLLFREYKLYGRDKEVSAITDAFCRVSSGRREALFIGGFSGSGKTRLFNGLTARVDVAGGYVISHTFDQMSKDRPLLAVVAVFNQLCLLIREKNYQHSQAIARELLQAFDSDISVLAHLLPNIYAMCPELESSSIHERERNDQVSLRSMCFTLQRFLRVVSSKAHPIVLFLDDLQWCDNSSLMVIESLLCDSTESNCLFFVGSYRSNEVADDHGIFRLINSLRTFGVPTSSLALDGLNPKDLNTMISDALCLFPRMCESLSNIVYTKTKGIPLFVLEFLRSLVDGKLLNYSLRKRRWIWNEDLIRGVEITDNVLFLLTSKMSALPNNIQTALKIGSCFGLKIDTSIVLILNASPNYSTLLRDLEQVVEEDFMSKIDSSEFKFVHDKVREAAYSLVPQSEKHKLHYSLGMTLYSMVKGREVDNIVFTIADQINYDIDQMSFESDEMRVEIAQINELAGVKARDCSDYVRSSSYFACALSLLPADHWKSHYEISLRVSFLLAESIHLRGESAEGILAQLLEECHSFDDKLPSLYLLVNIYINNQKLRDAFSICHEVLTQRGEQIPQSLLPHLQAQNLIEATSKMVESISYDDLIEMKEMDEEHSITLKFYNFFSAVAFFLQPEIVPFLIHRMIQLTMEHGFCKYSTMGFLNYAMVLCSSNMAKERILSAARLGKAALLCSEKRCHSSVLLPSIYCVYYGFVAFHTEPLQSCADMLGKGFDAALSRGDMGAASSISVQNIKSLIMAGENLQSLLDKVNYYLELSTTCRTQTGEIYHTIFRETILVLIDKGGSTNHTHHAENFPTEDANASVKESIYFHRAIQAYWQGHSERFLYFADKFFQMSSHRGQLNGIEMTFINALNSFQLLKRQNYSKFRHAVKNAIIEIEAAASNSSWNFSNKLHLLQAEDFSSKGKNDEARASYTSAITSAQFSGFIHEQGLACELAANHYKKIGDHMTSLSYFNQAKQCYVQWGSQMKVDMITRELGLLQIGNYPVSDATTRPLVNSRR